MALRESVAEVAEMMEKTAMGLPSDGDINVNSYRASLSNFATTLRLVLKASQGEAAKPSAPVAQDNFIRDVGARVSRIEAGAPRMVHCAGGSFDSTMIEVKPNMAVGEFVAVGGEAYQMKEDGELHFSASQTVRLNEEKARQK